MWDRSEERTGELLYEGIGAYGGSQGRARARSMWKASQRKLSYLVSIRNNFRFFSGGEIMCGKFLSKSELEE